MYESKTGNVKRYAEDIAKAIGAEIMPIKKFKMRKASQYDCLVFGGWVKGGNIQGIDDFLFDYESFKDKEVIIFSSGMAIPTVEGRAALISQNLLDNYHVRFYQFRGSFDFKKLKRIDAFMFRNALKMMEKKGEESVSFILERPIEFYDREKVEKVIRVINSLSSKFSAEPKEAEVVTPEIDR